MSDSSAGGGVVRILSDLHLGHPATCIKEVRQLVPLLEGVDKVIFNGDTCEQEVAAWRQKGTDQVEELKVLCRDLGVVARFLNGNHDPDLSSESWAELSGGKVFVSHGDMILPGVAPWSSEYQRRRAEVRTLLRALPRPAETLTALRAQTRKVIDVLAPDDACLPSSMRLKVPFLSALWPPLRPLNILLGWARMFIKAEHFVERYCPQAEVFLFGHYHRSGIRKRGGRVYCNTGSFTKGGVPLVVDLKKESMEVREVKRGEDDAYSPGLILRSFSLPAKSGIEEQ